MHTFCYIFGWQETPPSTGFHNIKLRENNTFAVGLPFQNFTACRVSSLRHFCDGDGDDDADADDDDDDDDTGFADEA